MPEEKRKFDWDEALSPLFRKYGRRKHPLQYKGGYELTVMVVLSSRSSDAFVNRIAPELFRAYPSLEKLSEASPEELFPYVRGITNFRRKSQWLVGIASALKTEPTIPVTMEELTGLPGIGRKSANVIIGELGGKPQGVIVDLHVARVAPRLGITKSGIADKIERDLMASVHRRHWHIAGMAMTSLGREICRPKNPRCDECVVNSVCGFYKRLPKREMRKVSSRREDWSKKG